MCFFIYVCAVSQTVSSRRHQGAADNDKRGHFPVLLRSFLPHSSTLSLSFLPIVGLLFDKHLIRVVPVFSSRFPPFNILTSLNRKNEKRVSESWGGGGMVHYENLTGPVSQLFPRCLCHMTVVFFIPIPL